VPPKSKAVGRGEVGRAGRGVSEVAVGDVLVEGVIVGREVVEVVGLEGGYRLRLA